jgi:hypothetical protein
MNGPVLFRITSCGNAGLLAITIIVEVHHNSYNRQLINRATHQMVATQRHGTSAYISIQLKRKHR